MGVVAPRMKIATLQGVLCAFLKMTEEEACDGAPLHCCILLFPPAVSPQNALWPLFLSRARMYPLRGYSSTWAKESQMFPPVYFDGRRKTRAEIPGSKSEQVKGAAPHTAPVHIGRQRRPRKTPVFGGFSETSCQICMVAPLRCCHTPIV